MNKHDKAHAICRLAHLYRLVFYLQMDSEGEEQTLKTCNSSTGEDAV